MTMSILYMNNRYILAYIKTKIYFFEIIIQDLYSIIQQRKIQKIVEEVTEKNPQNAQTRIKFIKKDLKKHIHKKIWTIPLLLESPKSKHLQALDLEIDF